MHKHRSEKSATARYRVLDTERRHFRWVSPDALHGLVRRGLARTFGTRQRVHGLILLVSRAEALAADEGPRVFVKPQPAKPGTYREHVANSWYIHQHCGARL